MGCGASVQSCEVAIEQYFVPSSVKLVFLDIGWGNPANTTKGQLLEDMSSGLRIGYKRQDNMGYKLYSSQSSGATSFRVQAGTPPFWHSILQPRPSTRLA